MPIFLKHVDKFSGKNVVEFGCNAGIYGYEISKVAKSYVGVDQGEDYIKQANVTKKVMKMNNAIFYNKYVKQFIRDLQKDEDRNEAATNINAIFASFVLYHLKDKETDLIKEYLLPKCDLVIILTRTSKRSPWKKYNSLKLHKIKNVEAYLESAGFVCESEMHDDGKFGITIATRKTDADNNGESGGSKKSSGKGTRGRRSSSVESGRVSEGSEMLSAEREATE